MARDAHTCLLVVAAPAEGRAVLAALGADPALAERPWLLHRGADLFDVLVCGIGKANAAGAVGRLADPGRHGLVLSVGVAGALSHPAPAGGGGAPILPLGSVIAATRCIFADEGLDDGQRFLDCSQMGFPIGPPPFAGNGADVPVSVLTRLSPLSDATGPIATVSTCSGTDGLARQVAARTAARAEAMEGAAVAVSAVRLGIPFGELRAISNTTGERARQVWDLELALARLHAVIGRLAKGASAGTPG